MCFCAIPFSIKDRKEKFMVYQVFMIRNESFKQHARINLSPAASSWVWEWENQLRMHMSLASSKKHKERLCGKTQRDICSTRRSNRKPIFSNDADNLGLCIHDAPKQALVKGRRVKCDERETQECEWCEQWHHQGERITSFKCACNILYVREKPLAMLFTHKFKLC
jgi:hypothetical protein